MVDVTVCEEEGVVDTAMVENRNALAFRKALIP